MSVPARREPQVPPEVGEPSQARRDGDGGRAAPGAASGAAGEPARARAARGLGPAAAGLAAGSGTEGDLAGAVPQDRDEAAPEGATRQAKAPWHFKVILMGSVVYLGWRAYQGVAWLAHHIH